MYEPTSDSPFDEAMREFIAGRDLALSDAMLDELSSCATSLLSRPIYEGDERLTSFRSECDRALVTPGPILYDDGPAMSELFPVGERVIIHHPFSGREQARGWIVGFTEGLVDMGGPESGPGPVEEADLIIVRCDGRTLPSGRVVDAGTRAVYVGYVEPEAM